MIEMNEKSKEAKRLFEQGYNCAQAIVSAFCEYADLEPDIALRLSSSFGGGIGRLREVCGAFSGAAIILGVLYGYSDPNDDEAKAKHYELIQSFAKEFKKENGSLICRELLGLDALSDSPIPDKRTENYYETRPCADIIEKSAKILDEYIKKEKGEEEMIKIAVASEKEMVTEHFGHCENFNIFELENGKITKSKSVENPGHKPGFLPNFLNEMGVNVIISGGMGGGAVDIFNEKGIEVIVGVKGTAKAAAEAYLNKELKSTGTICNHNH